MSWGRSPNWPRALARAPLWSQPPLGIVADVVVSLAFVLVAAAVVIDFASYYQQRRDVVRSDSSLVETGSMTAFFVVYYLVVRFGLLGVAVGGSTRTVMVVVGLVLVVLGVAFNVWGRLRLAANWANQIKIYEGHTLVTGGPYRVVRHPLYASLIWIFVGGSLIYANALALTLTFAVFVPMMYVRARREDALLAESFGARFDEYRRGTGMLLPGVWGR